MVTHMIIAFALVRLIGVLRHVNMFAFCLDARTLTFLLTNGLSIKPGQVKLLAGEPKATENMFVHFEFALALTAGPPSGAPMFCLVSQRFV